MLEFQYAFLDTKFKKYTYNYVNIIFHSHPGTEETIDISPLDFQLQDDQTFLISSLNHSENYSHNSLVSYIIEVPEGSYIFVGVSFLDTENG